MVRITKLITKKRELAKTLNINLEIIYINIMKQCPNCGAQIADDSRFCSECGKEITKANVCPHCGASVGEGDAFCQNCGRNLTDGSYANNSVINEQTQEDEEEPRRNWIPYILGAIALLAVCGGGWWFYNSSKLSMTTDVVAATDSLDAISEKEKVIKERLENIFSEVYTAKASTDFDELYLTSEYNNLLKKDIELSSGEIGFINSSHWVQGQDSDNPSMRVESVNMLSDNKAEAKIKIKAFDSSNHEEDVKLVMVYERDNWYIDDFISYFNGIEQSEKKGLMEYIAEVEKLSERTADIDTIAVLDEVGTIDVDTAVMTY